MRRVIELAPPQTAMMDRSPPPHPQLALDLAWDDRIDLDLFEAGPNAEAVAAIAASPGTGAPAVTLYGEAGTGKSHLLQAACERAACAGGTAVYLPLQALRGQPPDLCQGLEAMDLIAVDDGDLLPGRAPWQDAVFHLYNRVRERGGTFLYAGRSRPDALPGMLPDLASRLRWGLVFRLAPLDDAACLIALQRRAARRGLTLPAGVGRYLLSRYPRGAARLFAMLDTLDAASLERGRRLTIPFVREVLEPRR